MECVLVLTIPCFNARNVVPMANAVGPFNLQIPTVLDRVVVMDVMKADASFCAVCSWQAFNVICIN